jgi:hypothetical protein
MRAGAIFYQLHDATEQRKLLDAKRGQLTSP